MAGRSSAAHDRSAHVLQRARAALQGREVGIFESDARGHLRLLTATSEGALPRPGELERELAQRNIGNPEGRRWLASRLDTGRYAIAPIRSVPPVPPPHGVERRGEERQALERAGVALGVFELPQFSNAPSR